MRKEYFLGWGLLALGSLSFLYISKLIEVGGKHPVEAAILAILLGILGASFNLTPENCRPGVRAFEKPLILGIVLLGSSFNLSLFQSQGFNLFIIIAGTMGLGILSIYYLSRHFELSTRLALLLTVGTTICGGTAIAVIAPLINAREEETSYSIAIIALFGLLAILLYPLLASFLMIDDQSFGIFAGTAIHSTPQVLAAAFIYSDSAGSTATAVKLLRNCLLAPVALGVAYYWNRQDKARGQSENSSAEVVRAFPWFLFAYFIVAALCNTFSVSAQTLSSLTQAGKFFVLMGLFGVGLNSKLTSIRSLGVRPLIVGLLASLLVAAFSAALILLTKN